MKVSINMAAESRKRTLEALERRIQTEQTLIDKKAEALQRRVQTEHNRKEKKSKNAVNEDIKSPIIAPTSNDSSTHLSHPSSDTPNKGNSTLCCLSFFYLINNLFITM
jgi:uncharacterized protein with von Willebrand factor type A (vWA) domain